jgi:hypothetical protein
MWGCVQVEVLMELGARLAGNLLMVLVRSHDHLFMQQQVFAVCRHRSTDDDV